MEHRAPLKTEEVTKILDNNGLRRPMLIELLKTLDNGRNGNIQFCKLKGKEFQVESKIREYEGRYEFGGMRLRKMNNYVFPNATIDIHEITAEGQLIFRVHDDSAVSFSGARYSLMSNNTDMPMYTIVGVKSKPSE